VTDISFRKIPGLNQQTYQRLKLSLSLHLRRQIFVAVCDDLPLRDRMVQQLQRELSEPNDEVGWAELPQSEKRYPRLVSLQLNLNDPNPISQIAQWVMQSPPPRIGNRRAVLPMFQFTGIEQLTRQPVAIQQLFFAHLQNLERNLSALESGVLLWMPQPWFNALAQSAPDFWRCRTGTFEFIGEPTPLPPLANDLPAPKAPAPKPHAPTVYSDAPDPPSSTPTTRADQPAPEPVAKSSPSSPQSGNHNPEDLWTILTRDMAHLDESNGNGSPGSPQSNDQGSDQDSLQSDALTPNHDGSEEHGMIPSEGSSQNEAAPLGDDAIAPDESDLEARQRVATLVLPRQVTPPSPPSTPPLLTKPPSNRVIPPPVAPASSDRDPEAELEPLGKSYSERSVALISKITPTATPASAPVEAPPVTTPEAPAVPSKETDLEAKLDVDLEQATVTEVESQPASQEESQEASQTDIAAAQIPAQSLLTADLAETDSLPLLRQIELLHQQQAPPAELADAYRALGNFYRDRIEQGDASPQTLQVAVHAYEQVLVWLHETSSVWTDVLNDLGNLYWMQSRYASDMETATENLHQAIQSYQLALSKVNPQTHAHAYPMLHNNLGSAYADLARYQSPVENLQRAVQSYQQTLRYRTSENEPLRYASTQNNLGTAYWSLAQYQQPEIYLKQAIAAYSEALQHYTPDVDALSYAMIQNNLGTAYWNLSRHERPMDWLRLAVLAYQTALRYRTLESSPTAFAATQNNLGTAYWHLATQIKDDDATRVNYLHQAAAAYEATLAAAEEVTRRSPGVPLNFDILATHNNLGLAHYQLATDLHAGLSQAEQSAHLELALHHHLYALDGWQERPELRQTAFNCLLQTIRSLYNHCGLEGQNLALTKVPGQLLPEVLAQL
jgi:tetratricopeptide (TPR) repeat protein